MGWVFQTVRHFLLKWGYWAVMGMLLGENAGLPLPGETSLMAASFLAEKTHQLSFLWIVLIGILASTMGDNLGFLLGRRFGKTLVRWGKRYLFLDDEDIRAGEDLIRRHGAFTVFIARFIFGLRTIAGPLAGVLGMKWRRFALFNLLGAGAWVVSICLMGHEFADQFETLLDYFETAGWAIAAGLFLLGWVLWRRQKKRYQKRHQRQSNAA